MGEYAKRLSDGAEVKIGTCENMYYLRYEDRYLMEKLPGNVDPAIDINLRWRLPFEDEDDWAIYPGANSGMIYNRGFDLYRIGESGYAIGYSHPDYVRSPGNIQLRHDCGLLLNVTCYHGIETPKGNDDISVHWNGKDSRPIELAYIKNTDCGVFPIVRCKHCQTMWLARWEDVMPYIPEGEMRNRLSKYAMQ